MAEFSGEFSGEIRGEDDTRGESSDAATPATEKKRVRKPKFPWTEELSFHCFNEVGYLRPYQYVAGSDDSAGTWQKVLNNLKKNYPGKFDELTIGIARDHVRTKLKAREVVVRALAKESGIEVDETDYHKLQDSIIADRADCLSQHVAKKEKDKKHEEENNAKGKDIRMTAMESLSESKKRKSNDEDCPESKKRKERRSNSDVFGYLDERAKERRADKEAEMKMRESELSTRKLEANAMTSGILQMMTVLQGQVNYNIESQRKKEEREEQERAEREAERREREVERRDQRARDSQHQEQLTALFGALIKKLN